MTIKKRFLPLIAIAATAAIALSACAGEGSAVAPEPEPAYEERDHRKSGWSLFGSKKPRASQHDYAPAPRQTAPAAPEPQGRPQLDAQDDLEIPSFLRRLAN